MSEWRASKGREVLESFVTETILAGGKGDETGVQWEWEGRFLAVTWLFGTAVGKAGN